MCQSAQELIESASLTWNVTGQTLVPFILVDQSDLAFSGEAKLWLKPSF